MQRTGEFCRGEESTHLFDVFALSRASRPSTLATNGNLRSSSQSKQTSSTDLIFQVDVAYIPNHGHENYVDKEFFRRIRAEFYVLNAVQIHRRTLDSLIEGKEQWENNEQVTNVLRLFPRANDFHFRSHSCRHRIMTLSDNFF